MENYHYSIIFLLSMIDFSRCSWLWEIWLPDHEGSAADKELASDHAAVFVFCCSFGGVAARRFHIFLLSSCVPVFQISLKTHSRSEDLFVSLMITRKI